MSKTGPNSINFGRELPSPQVVVDKVISDIGSRLSEYETTKKGLKTSLDEVANNIHSVEAEAASLLEFHLVGCQVIAEGQASIYVKSNSVMDDYSWDTIELTNKYIQINGAVLATNSIGEPDVEIEFIASPEWDSRYRAYWNDLEFDWDKSILSKGMRSAIEKSPQTLAAKVEADKVEMVRQWRTSIGEMIADIDELPSQPLDPRLREWVGNRISGFILRSNRTASDVYEEVLTLDENGVKLWNIWDKIGTNGVPERVELVRDLAFDTDELPPFAVGLWAEAAELAPAIVMKYQESLT